MDTLLNYCKAVKSRLESTPTGMRNIKPWEEFALSVLNHPNKDSFETGDVHLAFLYTEFIDDRIWSQSFKAFARHYKKWLQR